MGDFFDDIDAEEPHHQTDVYKVPNNDYFIVTGWTPVDNADDSEFLRLLNYKLNAFNVIGKGEVLIENHLAIIVISKIEGHRKKQFYNLFYIIQNILKSDCLNIFIKRDNLLINECIQAKEAIGNNNSGYDKGFEAFWEKFDNSVVQTQGDYSTELPEEIKSLIKKGYNKVGDIVIINEDSTQLPDSTLDYIRSITDSIEFPLTDSQYELYTNIEWLRPSATKRFIPIFLKNKKDMPSYDEHWEGIDIKEDYKEYKPQGIVLGYYTRKDEDFCKGPHIVICPENIRSSSQSSESKIDFDTLLTEVLVHELGHAMMDIYSRDSKAQNCFPRDIFSKAMEESLANMITLCYFQKDRKKFKYVRSYIKNDQPVIYRFGTYQFDAGVDWTKWRDSDKNMPTLKGWFDKCFSEGDIRQDLDYSISDYDKVFE